MLGQVLFAEIPLADIGRPARVETGWIKDCKDPCDAPSWIKQERKQVDTIGCGYVPTNWSPVK